MKHVKLKDLEPGMKVVGEIRDPTFDNPRSFDEPPTVCFDNTHTVFSIEEALYGGYVVNMVEGSKAGPTHEDHVYLVLAKENSD